MTHITKSDLSHDMLVAGRSNALPDDYPLEMPVQDLWAGRRTPSWSSQLGARLWVSTVLSRVLLVFLTASASAFFAWGLYDVLQPSRPFPLLIALTVLSTVCFAWVAFGSSIAVVGAVNLALRGTADTISVPKGYVSLSSRNALLFPVYQEDPHEVWATIEAMSEQLVA
ncbi:MAG: hypothetical protein AAFO75_11670, partial [Pseudomonadota bacterium]